MIESYDQKFKATEYFFGAILIGVVAAAAIATGFGLFMLFALVFGW